MARLTHTGYGQLELNNVAFRRDGRIEAQCAIDSSISAGYIENGMLLAVDNVNRVVKYAADGTYPIALNYTAEHMYDDRANGLKDFKLDADSFLPRLGYLSVGDKFTTNTVSGYANTAAIKTAMSSGTVYGGASSDGTIALSTTKPTYGPILQVVACTTMPDGQEAVKLVCIQA